MGNIRTCTYCQPCCPFPHTLYLPLQAPYTPHLVHYLTCPLIPGKPHDSYIPLHTMYLPPTFRYILRTCSAVIHLSPYRESGSDTPQDTVLLSHRTVLHRFVLYRTIPYCIVSYCIILYNASNRTIKHSAVVNYGRIIEVEDKGRSEPHCPTLHCPALNCPALYCSALYCPVLLCPTLLCSALP